jgi:integrase
MAKFTTKRRPNKAGATEKPHPDFPLFPHSRGYWAKKVRGKVHYFGKVSTDPEGTAALQKWLDEKDDLLAGRKPRANREGLTIKALLNHFLTAKKARVTSGEILSQTWDEYHVTCKLVEQAFGLDRFVDDLSVDDFQQLRASMAKKWGPARLANQIQRVRSVFKYAYENDLIDKPIRFGSEFKKPSAKTMRKERAKKGLRLFQPDELKKMFDAAGLQLKAMLLLGINAGFGCTDCATLPMKAVDLKGGWVNFPRPKTGVARRCPLWPETLDAIKVAIKHRPAPKNAAHKSLVFVGQRGGGFAQAKQTHWLVSGETVALLKRLKLHREGMGFYALRHTFQTVAEDARDLAAVQSIMGHAPSSNDMSAVYRERISDERLKAVVDHMHQWLFGADAKTSKPEEISDGDGTAATGK